MRKTIDDRKQSQGYVDLKKKSEAELKELRERQLKLINNRSFISRLPDKGMRILNFKDQIEEEIKRRDVIGEASDLLSRVNLNGDLEEIEWTGNNNPTTSKKALTYEEDDDYNVDPLRLIATHCGTQKSRIKRDNPIEQSLVTQKDIEEATTFHDGLYAERLCRKYDKPGEPPERFKLNEPKSKEGLKSAFRSSSENVQKKLGKNWEVTAATPPVPIHGDVKKISLVDSLELQKVQVQRLKEIQFKEAIARLHQSRDIKMESTLPKTNLMNYRIPTDPCRLIEGTVPHDRKEEEPALDDEEAGGMSAVFYNIVDDVGEKS